MAIVISEVYGGGGNIGALYSNDFIELFNTSSTPVDLTGWSVQYNSANNSTTNWLVTRLTGTIPARGHFLIQQATGGTAWTSLPTTDVTGMIAMAAASGKVALVQSVVALIGASPTNVVDLVGYGLTNGYEGSGPAPTLSNVLSAQRNGLGAQDTNNNAADFSAKTPMPENSGTLPVRVRPNDFNGDSFSDMLWRYEPSGGV